MSALSVLLPALIVLIVPRPPSSPERNILPQSSFSASIVEADTLKEGDEAPMFVLRDLKTDEAIYLRDYTGQKLRKPSKVRHVVVLSFWSTWCEPCKVEIPQLSKMALEFSGKPAKFFLINTMEMQSTTEDSVRSAYASRGYTLPCLLDPTGRVGMRYSARSLPLVVVIDKEGIVRKVVRGFRESSYAEFGKLLRSLLE